MRFRCSVILAAGITVLGAGCASRVAVVGDSGQVDMQESMDKDRYMELMSRNAGIDEQLIPPSRVPVEIIFPGDELDIIIYEKLPVSQDKRLEKKKVNEAGAIFILPVGEIKVAGLSVTKAQDLVDAMMAEYIVSPHCEIAITKRAYEPQVYVFGEVQKNGTFPYKQGDRLLDALAAAGGCKNDAYLRSVKVVRLQGNDATMYSISLNDIMRKGDVGKNIALRDQDVVFIPRRFYTNLDEITVILGRFVPWYYLFRNF